MDGVESQRGHSVHEQPAGDVALVLSLRPSSPVSVMCTGRKVGPASVSWLLDLSAGDKAQVTSLLKDLLF